MGVWGPRIWSAWLGFHEKESLMYRVLSLCLVVLAVALFVAVPAGAADKDKADANTHMGKVVKVEGNKIVMVGKDGKDEHTHTLAPDAQITLDGKEAKLTDLKKDLFVRVTTKEGDKNTALRVEAQTKAFDDKDK